MQVRTFDFMGKRRIAAISSGVMLAVSCVMFVVNGLNYGLDFTGGTLVEVEFDEVVSPETVRAHLESHGFVNGTVQAFGSETDLLIRMPVQRGIEQAEMGDRILRSLQQIGVGVDMRQSNYVGPAVGEELRESGGIAMLVALAVVMVYIMLRFTGKFAIGAVVALVHDVVIVLGMFALTEITFDLPALAAVLAVVGYSLNDTIVVSDRIRENFRRMRKGTSLEIINVSLNQTLGRTLVTSMTTLLVLIALLILGGDMIRGFAIALTVGVVVGTYSSIYVAATALVLMKIDRQDLLMPDKEGAEFSDP